MFTKVSELMEILEKINFLSKKNSHSHRNDQIHVSLCANLTNYIKMIWTQVFVNLISNVAVTFFHMISEFAHFPKSAKMKLILTSKVSFWHRPWVKLVLEFIVDRTFKFSFYLELFYVKFTFKSFKCPIFQKMDINNNFCYEK